MNGFKLTLGQAAKQAGISKPYLSRLVSQGKISAERQENGQFRIDPSELDRLADIRSQSNRKITVSSERTVTPIETAWQHEREALLMVLTDRERQMTDLRDQINDLRDERDAWRTQAQTLLLTTGEKKEPEKKKWWRRFGK